MGTAIAAVAGFAKAYGAYIAVAVSVVSTAYGMLNRPDAPDTSPLDQAKDQGLKLNTRSTQEPIRVVYGTQKVGGNDVYLGTSGEDNKYLWIVQTLSEGECDSINTAGGNDQVWLGDKLEKEFGNKVWYAFHNGASNQAVDATLHAALAEWTDPLRYTCYIVFRLKYNMDYFQNMPSRQVELKGRKLFDFRDSSTAWSDNPVLALYDYITNNRYGMGINSAKLDITSWTAAANYCDTKGWTLNLVVTKDEAAIDTINNIMAHFRGTLVWFDGKYYLRYADLNYESSCMTLDDEHIVQDVQGRAAISISQPSKFKKPDGMRVRLIDKEKGFVTDDLMIGDDTGVVRQLDLLGCTDREMAANLGTYNLERLRLDRTISGRFRDDALKLEPHDIITLNYSALSISSQLMRVQDANILPDGLIELVMSYESLDLYDDDYDTAIEGVYACSLPDPTDEPPAVENASMTEETYNYRLRTFTRLNITFDVPSTYAWFDHVEVYLSYDNIDYEYLYNVNTDFAIENVEEGQDYYVRLKVVSIWGTKQADVNDIKLHNMVKGYTSAPDSLGSLEAIVNSNTINLYSAKVSDTDVELYEFRLGTSWAGAIFLAALRAPNFSLYGVKPGNHTFIANTLCNNGEYGDTPRSKAVTMIDPPDGWTVQNTETCDYNGVGTHDNTEHTTYLSDDYLKCSHTADVLVGTYTSPIYDRGTSGRYLIYCSADIAVTGAGTTWDDQLPSPTTWDQGGASTKTWNEIFTLSAGPSVAMKLKYGDTSPPTSEVRKLEILSAIATGRYFQMEITITDPNINVNALVENFTLKFCQ